MKKKPKKHNRSRAGTPVNQKHKDRLFRFVFQDKKYLLSLYNAINKTDYQNPEDLTITTLEDAVFLGMKNDLSFVIGATMNLYEHQSTQNANMPLRGLIYFAGLYQSYVNQNGYNLYGSQKIRLPFPNYVVFYNGESTAPDETDLFLSDCFPQTDRKLVPCLECKARMLNINLGHNRELMEKCKRLWEYAEFISQIRANLKNGLELSDAIRTAMNYCQSKGILSDILTRCQTEVLNMLLTEYNEKETMDYIRKEEREITRERINKLFLLLLNDNRSNDLRRAAEDVNFQEELFRFYGI